MVKPKKHLGQHFLTEHAIAQKIVGHLSCRYPVIEIGPGKGILSHYLAEKKPPGFRLIEVDPESVAYLRQFPDLAAAVIQDDFLRTDLQQIFSPPLSLLGNLPYNISAPVFFKILENRDAVAEVVCMVQKEVAGRITAPPGTKVYGILSVLLQTFYTAEYLFSVNEGVFFPPPKVRSAVMKLTRNERTTLPCSWEQYLGLVKSAFNQRRKTLRNALRSLIPDAASFPEQLGELRAEKLSVEDFLKLATLLPKEKAVR
ncbi:MAG TPA: 16S rRNA (adenine(1518)-N(6)/adenine(1519)-N(6))-dimethyltransferase RsmA [Bacteroidales bacterium]|nr:16S rRNA (adenine(1518)-N(6)/adenine(1519)-N(6))-dimethyltransferase RsmA [Bacteroidales bacterium]HSA42983.1 16S rRNA (adenine(1518)-N(6)/adenine(1519)-N(6))-dimethyltransferase RsmA [Bacteroidales bacterium]